MRPPRRGKGAGNAQARRPKDEERREQERKDEEMKDQEDSDPEAGEAKTCGSGEDDGVEEVKEGKDGGKSEGEGEGEREKGKGRGSARKRQKDWSHLVPAQIERPHRERRAVERYNAYLHRPTRHLTETKQGKGCALRDIPKVAANINNEKKTSKTLPVLYQSIFGGRRPAAKVNTSKVLLDFSGFVHEDEKAKKKMRKRFERLTNAGLRDLLQLLDMATGGKKEEKLERLLAFLEQPRDRAPSSSRKPKAPEGEEATPTKGRKRNAEEAKADDEDGEDEAEDHEDYETLMPEKAAKGRDRKIVKLKTGRTSPSLRPRLQWKPREGAQKRPATGGPDPRLGKVARLTAPEKLAYLEGLLRNKTLKLSAKAQSVELQDDGLIVEALEHLATLTQILGRAGVAVSVSRPDCFEGWGEAAKAALLGLCTEGGL